MRDLPHFARFWMICQKPTGPRSQTNPTTRYSQKADAEEAAKRLAAQKGAQFLILEAVGIVDPDDPSQRGLNL
jgi:hypothetical protein